jgi:FdhD protein
MPAQGGAIVITSRVSVEMVQKAAMIGAAVLVAISAPTALAVRTAEAANVALVALARGTSHSIFSHPERII